MIEVDPIRFVEWVPWADLSSLATYDRQLGVYAWTHSHQPLSLGGVPFPDVPEQLIYVGETKNLKNRPFADQHAGFERYREVFPADRDYRFLYVSVFVVAKLAEGDPTFRVLRAYTRYVEDLVYWEYARRFERRAALDYSRKPGYTFPRYECCAAQAS